MGEKGELFLVTDLEGWLEVENYFAIVTVKIELGKNREQTLNFGGKF